MENIEIAGVFNQIADLLEIKADNPFRVRSYRNAAASIEDLTVCLAALVEHDEKALSDIPGIGKGTREKIIEMTRTGRCAFLGELLDELPEGLLEILKIPGVGTKKAGLWYRELSIGDVESLQKAATGGKLRSLAGMGAKTEEKLLKAIESYKNLKESSKRFCLSTALPLAKECVAFLSEGLGCVTRLEIVGSLRRWEESVGDIDLLAVADKDCDFGVILDYFSSYEDVKEVIKKTDSLVTILLRQGIRVDLNVTTDRDFPLAMIRYTGSKSHINALTEFCKKTGAISLIEDIASKPSPKMPRRSPGKDPQPETEEQVYSFFGLDYIPPELREGKGEIEMAESDSLPRLVCIDDIRGDLHMHTTASDGAGTLEEMAHAAIDAGYEYIAVTDHSKAVGIARGLDEKRLLSHIKEIDILNEKLKQDGKLLRILKGSEVDIKADGTLDYDSSVLEQLDWVVGAVHSAFTMDKEAQTGRIVSALATGWVNVLAHPTGRLIGLREPYEVDMERVIDAAAKFQVFMELNSYPQRLDLSSQHCALARQRGVKIAISTDSHSSSNLGNMVYGVHTARRGGLSKVDVLNTRPLPELLNLINLRTCAKIVKN